MTRVHTNSINTDIRAKLYDSFLKKFSGTAKKVEEHINKEIKFGKPISPISKRTVDNFFNQSTNMVNLSTLDSLCFALINENSYTDAVENLEPHSKGSEEPSTRRWNSKQSVLLEKVIDIHYKENVRRYQTLKVSTMNEPMNLNRILVDINLLRRKTKQEILINKLDRHTDFGSFEDIISFTFSVQESGIDSFCLLEKYDYLMVWGKLGTGKTTLFKTIATRDKFMSERHPVLIELRKIEEKKRLIKDAIIEDFYTKEIDDEEVSIAVENLLGKGQLIILLDGLDEVSKSNFQDICKQIENLVDKYSNNQFLVSCRYGIYDYGFNNFTEVEVAKLSEEKMIDFIKKWFGYHEDEERGKKIIEILQRNPLLKDFASTPLMLNLLCLNIRAGYGVPENIFNLYQKAINTAAEKWDQHRFIERDKTILTTNKRLSFLSRIAFKSLDGKDKKYTWRFAELKHAIKDFIENSGKYNPETIEHDCELEVQAIEGYHSLLERTVDETYQFSTPAYQHYFTAVYVEASRDRELIRKSIEKHILDKQWRQIFLMVAEKLQTADEMLLLMLKKANSFIDTPELKSLFTWLNNFTIECGVSSSSWRAGVLTIDMELDLRISRYSIPLETRTIAHQIAISTHELNRRRKATKKATPEYIVRLALAAALALAEDKAGVEKLFPSSEPSEFAKEYLGNELLSIDSALKGALENIMGIRQHEVIKELSLIANSKPEDRAEKDNWDDWDDWAKNLRTFMIENFDIGKKVKLSPKGTKSLSNYLYIVAIIVECLLIDSTISSEVREALHESLFLPPNLLPDILSS